MRVNYLKVLEYEKIRDAITGRLVRISYTSELQVEVSGRLLTARMEEGPDTYHLNRRDEEHPRVIREELFRRVGNAIIEELENTIGARAA